MKIDQKLPKNLCIVVIPMDIEEKKELKNLPKNYNVN